MKISTPLVTVAGNLVLVVAVSVVRSLFGLIEELECDQSDPS